MREYTTLTGLPNPNTEHLVFLAGPGTVQDLWSGATFNTELKTSCDDLGRNALSRHTVASLQNIAYQVDYGIAGPYILPIPCFPQLLLKLNKITHASSS